MRQTTDRRPNSSLLSLCSVGLHCAFSSAQAQPSLQAQNVPSVIAAVGEQAVITLHAEGSQVYECKANADGKLAWAFREPVATFLNATGQTIGRHYAGTKWELTDGSLIVGKVAARADGARAEDIPLLKLSATALSEIGVLGKVSTIQRIAMVGGQASGTCDEARSFKSVAYSADYVFLAKP